MKPILYLSTANKKGIYQLDRYIEAGREENDRLVRIQPFSFINPSNEITFGLVILIKDDTTKYQ